MSDKIHKYTDVLQIVGNLTSVDQWVLVPYPIPSLRSRRAEFEQAVNSARVQLVHEKWETVGEAVRELSDAGGIEYVNVVRVKRMFHHNATFRDGKRAEDMPSTSPVGKTP